MEREKQVPGIHIEYSCSSIVEIGSSVASVQTISVVTETGERKYLDLKSVLHVWKSLKHWHVTYHSTVQATWHCTHIHNNNFLIPGIVTCLYNSQSVL